ncbi:regulator of sigma E protease, partial [Trypanosoma cruzi]
MDTPQTPTAKITIRRAASGRNAQCAEHVGIFTHVRCGAIPLHSPAHPIGAIHSSLAWRCDQCDSSVLPSPSPSCSSMPSVSPQYWCSLAAIAAFVECTTTNNAPHAHRQHASPCCG